MKIFNEGSVSGINEDPEDHFNSKMKQSIKRFVIFNNQTEKIEVILIHRFVIGNQSYLGKLFEL